MNIDGWEQLELAEECVEQGKSEKAVATNLERVVFASCKFVFFIQYSFIKPIWLSLA